MTHAAPITKPYACPDCERSFGSELRLKQHRASKHGGPKPQKIPCPHCGKLVSPQGMWMHQATTRCGDKS